MHLFRAYFTFIIAMNALFTCCLSEENSFAVPSEKFASGLEETDQNTGADSDRHHVVVQDYLETLTNEELEKICHDRGFFISKQSGSGSDADDTAPLQREDYLSAARRCLTLEDEMNAIIATHPELAAELDAEIERMRVQKNRLERERDEILAQKTLLEEQLAKAGVDVSSCLNETKSSRAPFRQRDLSTLNPNEMTLDEVLRYSFVLLYHRVMQDVESIRRILDPLVLQPMRKGLFIAWKYSKPTILLVLDKGRIYLQPFLSSLLAKNATNTLYA